MDAVVEPEDVHVRPWWAPLTIVAFVGLVICTNVANAVWARWVDSNPAALLALSSRQRYLALSVPGGIGVTPYIIIGTLRISAAFIVCHLAGRAYRDDLLRLFTRYLGLTPEALDAYHQALDKAEVAIIPFFVGSNIIAVLTGIRRTHPFKLGVLLAIGIAGRLALIWWLAKAFEEPLVDVLGWVQRYQWWVVIASVVLVIVINVRNFRRGASQGRCPRQTSRSMAEITFRGNPITTVGELPPVGEPAPAFMLTGTDLGDISNDSYAGRPVVLNIYPSIDTRVCATSVRTFNERVADSGVPVVCVSEDLPFASARFCGAEGIEHVKPASSFRSSFGADFGVTIADGPLAGLLARSVIVLDADGKVAYTELVPEIAQEPNYDAALAAVADL